MTAKKAEKSITPDRGEIILYQTTDGKAALDVRMAGEILWLSLNPMGGLFGRVVSKLSARQ